MPVTSLSDFARRCTPVSRRCPTPRMSADAPGASASLGVTGVMGHPGVADAIRSGAVCLLVGTRLSVTARAGLDAALRETCTLSIGSAPPYLPSIHVHTNDLRASLAELTRRLTNYPPQGLGAVDSTPPAELRPPTHRGPGIRYRDAITALDAVLPDEADIVVDAGNTGAAAIHHLPARRAGRFVVALGMGGMGYSFGAGIGMAFARRRRTVIVAGDGSFFMHGLELHTAIQYRLPVTLVLFNNNAHAMCVTREKLFYDGIYSYNRFTPSRLGAGLAAMFPGLPAVDVTDIDALATGSARRAGCRRPVGRQHRVLSRRNPAVRTVSRPRLLFQPTTRRTPMSLPALEDIAAHRLDRDDMTGPIEGVIRIETSPREKATPIIMEMMRSVYPHDEVFGPYCTVNEYIDCPPDELYGYLADTRSLEEWTYSLRGFTPTDEAGLWLAYDRLGSETEIYTRTVSQPEARTVDYHCAWDQGKHLWMIYLMRVVDAQVVLDKPGSVVLWTNCHHPFYDHNPYPEAAPPERPVWVGDFWDMFGAGHRLELLNLKAIAEYRHHNGLPVKPDWMR